MRFDVKKEILQFLAVTVAACLLAININTFVHTGGLYPGGATGLTVLLQRAFLIFFEWKVPYTVINLLLNAVPIFIGFRYIGKKFTLLSCYVIVLTSFLTDLLPHYVITYDVLLISVFGGIINGAVISICLMMNANTGGTDFIAVYLSEKKGVDSFNVILVFNVGLLIVAGLMFGWDKALYSIIFQYASTQVVHGLYRRYQQQTLFIVTDSPEEVSEAISGISRHGATIMEGVGAYSKDERKIVYSVVSRSEYKRVIEEIVKTDEKAFINSIRTEDLTGRFYRKPTE